MFDNVVVLANTINFIGVLLLLGSHTVISLSGSKLGFILSALGGIIVASGSYLLGSYPIVFLNVVWLVISFVGLHNHGKEKTYSKIKEKDFYLTFALLSSVIVIAYTYLKNLDLLAYYASFLYIASYGLFAAKRIEKDVYLTCCFIGFFFILPHLIEKQQYSVMINEGYGAVVSLLGILKAKKILAKA